VAVTRNLERIIRAADKVAPGKVFWKESSPQKGEIPRHPKDIDMKAKRICGGEEGRGGPCTYVTFPNFPQRLKQRGEPRGGKGLLGLIRGELRGVVASRQPGGGG
jgi:hypothetical protein